MAQEPNWFIEKCEECGSGFSLEVTEKLHSETTPFQTIDIYQTTNYGRLMVIDGFIMLTQKDNFLYHEMMTHPVLFTHPHPERVLIIGGGDCGTLKEVLRHPTVKTVEQIEIDERVTRLSEQFFPELCSANQDSRASLRFIDGIKWVNDADADSYDVIIVDSTDPIGPAEGLFNQAFYQQCHRVLGEKGILVQQSESPISHISLLRSMRKAMSDAGFSTVHTLDFPQPVYPSGWWTATLAFKSGNMQQYREQDIKQRPFETLYYSFGKHMAAVEETHYLHKHLT